ncbi:MAG: cupin domain-containing protein [Rhodospirillaceae bacterium]
MPRPHIEFIQCQAVAWRAMGEDTARPGAEAKPLSFDESSKAVTTILRYPAGWTLAQDHYVDSDEELFVLSGALTINGTTYEDGDYAYLPAGFQRSSMTSTTGADVMTFFEGAHQRVEGSAPSGLYNRDKLVERIPTKSVTWGSATDPKVAAPGVKRLGLRQDPDTGDTTWMLDVDETGMTGEVNRLETHPVVEEVFLLSGEFHMPMGVLKKGAYFWRPPGIPHGPVGTNTGALGLFRCKGGPLTTEWSDEAHPVQWDAPYKPYLPDELAAGLAPDYDPSLPY